MRYCSETYLGRPRVIVCIINQHVNVVTPTQNDLVIPWLQAVFISNIVMSGNNHSQRMWMHNTITTFELSE